MQSSQLGYFELQATQTVLSRLGMLPDKQESWHRLVRVTIFPASQERQFDWEQVLHTGKTVEHLLQTLLGVSIFIYVLSGHVDKH